MYFFYNDKLFLYFIIEMLRQGNLVRSSSPIYHYRRIVSKVVVSSKSNRFFPEYVRLKPTTDRRGEISTIFTLGRVPGKILRCRFWEFYSRIIIKKKNV